MNGIFTHMLATGAGAIGAFACIYLTNRDSVNTNNIECQKVKQQKPRPKLEKHLIQMRQSEQMETASSKSALDSSQSEQSSPKSALDSKSSQSSKQMETASSSQKSVQELETFPKSLTLQQSENPAVLDLGVSQELKRQEIDAPFVEVDSNTEKRTYGKDGSVTAVDTSTIMIHNPHLELVDSPVTVDDNPEVDSAVPKDLHDTRDTRDVVTQSETSLSINHTVMLLAEMKEKANKSDDRSDQVMEPHEQDTTN